MLKRTLVIGTLCSEYSELQMIVKDDYTEWENYIKGNTDKLQYVTL